MTDKERLRQYQDLLEAGAITEDEFNDMTKHLRERIQADEQLPDEESVAESETLAPSVAENPISEDKTDSTADEVQSGDDVADEPSIEESIEVNQSENVEDEQAASIENDSVADQEPLDSDDLAEGQSLETDEELQPTKYKKPKYNYDLIIAAVVVLIVLIGGGAVVVRHNQQNAKIGMETTQKDTSKSKASSAKTSKKTKTDSKKNSSEKKKSSSEKKKTPEKVAAQWSDSQMKELADYMGVWQQAVGQTYVGTYDGGTPQHLTYKFPEALQKGKLDGHLKLDNKDVSFTWSPKADKKADYQVVAVATGSRQGSDAPMTYFFVIHDGQGTVYATETASGEDLTLSPTQNADLQNNFASIVNEQAESSSATSESQANITFNDGTTVSES
ncbi:DUF4767 domain-containing protein [Weissella paramesenteroides]|uniref:DUF4767 domain-containing protein n=1 Tax=Weissella paramesenteroides TaxID=1249 RepID=UPI0023F91364|nr:DUF4767 domain-containing protein [Weissella paramesenteroides]MDF8375314.1 DUF4767 domain-containing protein [Weissella paramesenteroides]